MPDTMPKNSFRDAVESRSRFIYTFELVPGRGSRGKVQESILQFADEAARGGRIDAVSITDNPGGHPALAPDVIGSEIKRLGLEPIIHFTSKDKNRNQMESILYAFDRLGIHNLLVMTGDYPQYGFEGKAKPVFDIDSVQALRLISRMNEGLHIDARAPGGGIKAFPTNVFAGCAVSPFKKLESETMAQYFKLEKKIAEGAGFVVTQVGFDARKFDELLRYMRGQAIDVPVIGNVYILNPGVARSMNAGRIPGCVVTDSLYARCLEESKMPDKGRSAALIRAVKQIAVLKGIGYSGAHISGPGVTYKEVEWILDKSEEMAAVWATFVPEFDFPMKDGFYLYEKDLKTGLNTDKLSRLQHEFRKSIAYACMRFLHRLLFMPNSGLYVKMCALFSRVEGRRFEKPMTEVEYWSKFLTSRCRRCGDCTLAEVGFLCPQSQCPKFLFNGQCGGSRDGWCEVFPGERRCIYVRAYDRYKGFGEEKSLRNGYIKPRDWALDETSSWLNYFLGRDHYGNNCRGSDV